jgi:glycosyltransferase involved in cell wall biosynthesis
MLSLIDALGTEWVGSVIFLAPGPVVEEVRARGVPVTVVRERHRAGLLLAALAVRRVLRRQRPRIVHANHLRAAFVGAFAVAGTRRRLIWHRHDSTGDGWIASALARRVHLIVGVSDTVNSVIADRGRNRVRTIYNGVPSFQVDRAAAREMVLKHLGVSGNPRVVLLAGRLSPQKGQLDLIDATPHLLAARPDLMVALAGAESWPYIGYERRLRERVRELGVEEAVSFLGQLPSGDSAPTGVVRFMAGCDVVVAPSRREQSSGWEEGFGLTPLQAMSAGTPVVAYRHGAFSETLDDCALMVPEGDVAALVDAILQALTDEKLRSELTRRGADWVRRFDAESATEEMKRVYRELSKL